MRAWICVLAPGCYERAAWAERKSALQGSGLVRTVGPCVQKRVALMPWAIVTARDTFLSIERLARKRRVFREAGLLQGRHLLFGQYGHGRTDFLKVRHSVPSLSLHGILWLSKLAAWSYTITIIANIKHTIVTPLT